MTEAESKLAKVFPLMADRRRRWRESRLAFGLCINCGREPRMGTLTLGALCWAKRNDKRNRSRAICVATGKCPRCYSPLTEADVEAGRKWHQHYHGGKCR
jgi:hypothetical protein